MAKSCPENIKRGCFAFFDNYGQMGCSALKQLMCSKPDYRCSFYKPMEQEEDELIAYNGTANLCEALQNYSDTHKEKEN